MKRVGLESSHAASEAVRMANADVIAAYPITPQTHIVERLAEMVADGELDAEFICAESEHSAMSTVTAASAAGARAFTCTAGQGLELMHEMIYVTSSMRLPVVACIANRALSSPLSVWGDHSDAMAVRDTSWIQMFAEDAQEVFDLTLCAYRMAEDHRVLFPAMVHLDGFHLSHVMDVMELPDKDQVDEFLPPYEHPFALDPDKPLSMGCYGPPYIYTEVKKAQEEDFETIRPVIPEIWKEFEEIFDRKYSAVEGYKTDDAEILLLTQGSFSTTARMAVDEMREEGKKVGHIHLRLWRPFPFNEIRKTLRNKEIVIVFDRCISFGMGGPVASEIKSAMYHEKDRPMIISFIGGLGGRDVFPEDFEFMVDRAMKISKEGIREEFEMIGVRE